MILEQKQKKKSHLVDGKVEGGGRLRTMTISQRFQLGICSMRQQIFKYLEEWSMFVVRNERTAMQRGPSSGSAPLIDWHPPLVDQKLDHVKLAMIDGEME